mgnify:CR=1 FL=1
MGHLELIPVVRIAPAHGAPVYWRRNVCMPKSRDCDVRTIHEDPKHFRGEVLFPEPPARKSSEQDTQFFHALVDRAFDRARLVLPAGIVVGAQDGFDSRRRCIRPAAEWKREQTACKRDRKPRPATTDVRLHELRGLRNEAVPPRVATLFVARLPNDVLDGARPIKNRRKSMLKTLCKLWIGWAE